MAVQFTQQPTSPNGTQSTIVYGIGNASSQPQVKYLCDIKDTSGNLLVRLKQPKNESGYAVFELQDILHDYTDWDNIWTISALQASNNNNTRTFSIEFGEEYGTSTSSSVAQYPSQITSSLVTIPAVTELYDGFNWDSGSYTADYLTTSPTDLYVRPSEYGTLSHMNDTASTIASYTVTVFNASGGVIAANTMANGVSTSTEAGKLIHIPFGPQNFKNHADLNILTGSNWDYYTVTSNIGKGSKTIHRLPDCVEEYGTRFAFVNKLGVFDYFTAELVNTEAESYADDIYEQTFVNFSTTDGTISFDKSRRGQTIYNKTIQSDFTATTDWLNQEQADWLMELFQSPSVYKQYGDGFIPIIITNQQVQKKTNPRGQKLFNFAIQYKLANNRKSRR